MDRDRHQRGGEELQSEAGETDHNTEDILQRQAEEKQNRETGAAGDDSSLVSITVSSIPSVRLVPTPCIDDASGVIVGLAGFP